MHVPWASNLICIGHANVCAAMIGKVHVVIAKGILYPVRHLDQRGSLNVAAHSSIHLWGDDGAIAEAAYCDVGRLSRLQSRTAK